MTHPTETSFEQARKDFLGFLKYTKGHSDTTCYNYNSDLGIWRRWLDDAQLDWRSCKPTDLENFVSHLSREGVGVATCNRKRANQQSAQFSTRIKCN